MATSTLTTAQLSSKVETLEKDVEKHDEWIEGNGKKGAKSRMDALETAQNDIIKRLDKIGNLMTALLLTVLGGGIGWFLFEVLPGIIGHVGAP